MMDRIMSMPQAGSAYAFAAPPGFSIPEDVQEGQPFEVVAKIRLDGSQLVFDEINGVKLEAETEEAEPEGYEDEDLGDEGDMTDDLATVGGAV